MSEVPDEFDAAQDAIDEAQEVIDAVAYELPLPTPEVYAATLQERDEYLDNLKRLQAEFDNFRKRVAREKRELSAYAVGNFAEELLPVLDACQAALSHGAQEIEPVASALNQALVSQGLTTLGQVGDAFDPKIHDAVMHEPGDGPQVVAEVLRPGYAWGDRVLRAAMVKVSG